MQVKRPPPERCYKTLIAGHFMARRQLRDLRAPAWQEQSNGSVFLPFA